MSTAIGVACEVLRRPTHSLAKPHAYAFLRAAAFYFFDLRPSPSSEGELGCPGPCPAALLCRRRLALGERQPVRPAGS